MQIQPIAQHKQLIIFRMNFRELYFMIITQYEYWYAWITGISLLCI